MAALLALAVMMAGMAIVGVMVLAIVMAMVYL